MTAPFPQPALGRVTGITDPTLSFDGGRQTSEPDRTYNCVGWAFGRNDRWWWPDFDTWPIALSGRGYMLDEFLHLFKTWGWADCTSASHETGIQKIALFVKADGEPTHLARMVLDDTYGDSTAGLWTSKLERDIDVLHELNALEGPALYGQIHAIYSKPVD